MESLGSFGSLCYKVALRDSRALLIEGVYAALSNQLACKPSLSLTENIQ